MAELSACQAGLHGEITTGNALLVTRVELPADVGRSLTKGVGSAAGGAAMPIPDVVCKVLAFDGTLLGTATSDAEGMATFAVDEARALRVMIRCDLTSTIQLANAVVFDDLTTAGAAACGGSRASTTATAKVTAEQTTVVRATDLTATVATQAFLYSCEREASVAATIDAPAGCNDVARLRGVWETTNSVLASSGAADGKDTGGTLRALTEAVRTRLLDVGELVDVKQALAGNPTALGALTPPTEAGWSVSIRHAQEGLATIPKVFEDPTVVAAGGTEQIAALANFIGSQTAETAARLIHPSAQSVKELLPAVVTTCGGGSDSGGGTAGGASGAGGTATVVDTVPPTVQTVTPANGATNVATSATVRITFSEALAADSVSATSIQVTYPTRGGTTAVTGTLTIDGTVVTFTPTVALANSRTYTVAVTTGVKDAAGNAMAADTTTTFTTVATDLQNVQTLTN